MDLRVEEEQSKQTKEPLFEFPVALDDGEVVPLRLFEGDNLQEAVAAFAKRQSIPEDLVPVLFEQVRAKVDEVLEAVGIDPTVAANRRPHEFSGGQCQRISIARAVVLEPEILICDEPVSALDVSVQAQILNLLEEMKSRYGLTLVFIGHDLSVVRNVSDRVIVMYLGKVCEVGNADAIYSSPAHPYTRVLLASAPEPASTVDESESAIGDEIPSPIHPPSGCRFRTRCPRATDRCATEEPVLRELVEDHFVACHFPS